MGFLPEMNWDICALSEQISDDKGLCVIADKVNMPLSSYDIVFVPGGMGTRKLQNDNEFINWIQSAKNTPLKISVCTGSLILGAAGFLKNKKATTHKNAMNDLKKYTNKAEFQRIIDEENIITGSGVATSIDLGLYLVQELTNSETREKIAKQMDYPYK